MACYEELLHELPRSLIEWAAHTELENSELLAIDPGGAYIRQIDLDFLMSVRAKDVFENEGFTLLDH